jgi:hypothetical protein
MTRISYATDQPGNEIPRLKGTKSAEADCTPGNGVPFRGLFRDSAGEFIPRSPASCTVTTWFS